MGKNLQPPQFYKISCKVFNSYLFWVQRNGRKPLIQPLAVHFHEKGLYIMSFKELVIDQFNFR